DEDVEAAFNKVNDVFPTAITTSLERVRQAAFDGAKQLDDQPREWMHQILAAVDSYDLVQARMRPAFDALRARYTRLKTLQQPSADYLEAAREAQTGNIERSRALLRKVIEEYGQGELKPVLEKRLERLDTAAHAVQEIEQHVRNGEMEQAHAQALKAAEDYKDLQIPSTLGIPTQVRSLPSGARVFVNEQESGTTPLVLRLPLGSRVNV